MTTVMTFISARSSNCKISFPSTRTQRSAPRCAASSCCFRAIASSPRSQSSSSWPACDHSKSLVAPEKSGSESPLKAATRCWCRTFSPQGEARCSADPTGTAPWAKSRSRFRPTDERARRARIEVRFGHSPCRRARKQPQSKIASNLEAII